MRQYILRVLARFMPVFHLFLRRQKFMRCRFHENMEWYGERFDIKLEEAFDTYLSAEERNDKRLIRRLTKDIVNCHLLYGASPREYFFFDFPHRSALEREAYLTGITKCNNLDLSIFDMTENKAFAYNVLKPFYKRETVAVRDENDRASFMALAERSSRLFVKTLCGYRGQGAKVLELNGRDDAARAFDSLLAEKGEWQVEEFIKQADVMARWNPDAVNTVRIPSFLINGQIHLLGLVFRTGTKGAVADNGGSGGIVSSIDEATGVLTTDGIDTSRRFHSQHPDTGLTYKGFQIPDWKQLLRIAEEAHRCMPQIRYLAFDCAYTEQGWVIVEVNCTGGMSSTQVLKAPIKETFIRYMQAS